jgi:hypothetical protein
MRFKLADQVLIIAVFAIAACYVREAITLHRRGFEGSSIAFIIGTVAGLDFLVGWVAIALCRWWQKHCDNPGQAD